MRRAAAAVALSRAVGRPVEIQSWTSLGGGSINHTERLETSAGPFVLKSTAHAPAGFFEAEADGLRALATSGTPLIVPEVVALGDDAAPFLVLQDLGHGAPAGDFDERLGRGLAALHRRGHRAFGFHHDNLCGLTPQPNAWADRWVEFYRTARLEFQLRRLRDAGLLSVSEAARVDDLIGRLDKWIDEPANGPSLIHGDLWSGNVHTARNGQPALIDPAVSYAHREAELGMMTLFGGFSPRVFAAYDESHPLESGWRERNGLYQLYHVLNHLALFGRAYAAQAMALVQRF